MPYQLTEYASAVADANGIAIARIGPRRSFERWHVTGVTVSSSSVALEPRVDIYRGGIGPAFKVGGTYSGKNDSGNADDWVDSGQDLIAVWTGADVGAQCSMTLSGESHR